MNLDNYLSIEYPHIDMGDRQYSDLTRDLYYLEKLIRLNIIKYDDKIYSRSTILKDLITKKEYYICTDKIHCKRKVNCINLHIMDILKLLKDNIKYSSDIKVIIYVKR